jgi:hypothetical protein
MILRRGARTSELRALLALTGMLALLLVPSSASAKKRHAHRPNPVVASGTSLFGVPWQATVQNGAIQFTVDSSKRYKRGWVARTALPSTAPSVFSATLDTSVDPRPEAELAGVTSPDVAMLEVHMSDGSIFEIYPAPASAAAQNRYPWLTQLRLFNAFFPYGGVNPQIIDALDANNNVLAERASSNGSF